MTDRLIPNEIDAEYDNRALNKAVATYTAQLRMAKRDADLAEAQALSAAASLGGNAEDRKRNAVLYLAGQLSLAEEQAEYVRCYQSALALVDQIEHDLGYLVAEVTSRRQARTEAQTQAQQALADTAPSCRFRGLRDGCG